MVARAAASATTARSHVEAADNEETDNAFTGTTLFGLIETADVSGLGLDEKRIGAG